MRRDWWRAIQPIIIMGLIILFELTAASNKIIPNFLARRTRLGHFRLKSFHERILYQANNLTENSLVYFPVHTIHLVLKNYLYSIKRDGAEGFDE